MTFEEYSSYFEYIINKMSEEQVPPYDDAMYLDYTKLNWSRSKRWFKTGKLSEQLLDIVKSIKKPQQWILITEPWCGDASHNVPFIEMIARENPLISVSYELRDSKPNRINEYMTNGGKSIPKLIIRNIEGSDLGTWGPRPQKVQEMYTDLLENNASFDEVKVEMQNWYNANKGQDIQKELAELLSNFETA